MFFPQRLPDALRQAAVDLAVHQHGIEHAAAIVHRVVVPQPHLARLRVHFHNRQVRAEWKRVIGRLEDGVLR